MKFDIPLTDTVDDDRAVSPVVGVALLIAITVILAAVIGFVVLDTTVSTTDTPSVRLSFEQVGSDRVEITHEGGDTFDPEHVYLRVQRQNNPNSEKKLSNKMSDTFNTGDTFAVQAETGDRIVIYWADPKSDREFQLGSATIQ